MNDNPWHVESMVRMRRERIQEEMRRIRLEERALNAPTRPVGLVVRLWTALQRWYAKLENRGTPSRHVEPPASAPFQLHR
jgi:hypothetical protein